MILTHCCCWNRVTVLERLSCKYLESISCCSIFEISSSGIPETWRKIRLRCQYSSFRRRPLGLLPWRSRIHSKSSILIERVSECFQSNVMGRLPSHQSWMPTVGACSRMWTELKLTCFNDLLTFLCFRSDDFCDVDSTGYGIVSFLFNSALGDESTTESSLHWRKGKSAHPNCSRDSVHAGSSMCIGCMLYPIEIMLGSVLCFGVPLSRWAWVRRWRAPLFGLLLVWADNKIISKRVKEGDGCMSRHFRSLVMLWPLGWWFRLDGCLVLVVRYCSNTK